MWLVLRDASRIGGLGLVLGLALAAGLAHALQAALFGVSPTDATALLGMAAALGTAVVAASVPPAARAARTDPLVALRQE
jgi:putative ABC transport system permease protein